LPHLWPTGSSLDSRPRLRPGSSPHALRIPPRDGHPALRGSRPPRPARHYPRFWICRSSSERQRDLNPPERCAAQRTSGRRRRLVEAHLRPPLKPSVQFSRTGLSPKCVFRRPTSQVHVDFACRRWVDSVLQFPRTAAFWVFHKRNLSTAASLLTGFPLRANHFGPSPSPAHCAASCEVTPLSRRFWYCSTVRRLAKHRFPFRSRL